MAGPDATNHFQRTTARESVLWRNSKYRKTCKDGFRGKDWEAHHICCNHAVEGRKIKTNRGYVEDCLWITKWDLNARANLIGLPMYEQYKSSSGASPQNRCAHDVDHNTDLGYTDECHQWLELNIWETLNDKKEDHTVNAANIATMLESCTSTFKGLLVVRGSREKGTLLEYQTRFDPGRELLWYHPFSMADLPRKRHPGTKGDMSKIFNLIG